ncbi:MAG: ATP-binding protein, partial [Caldilineaceae bacterium]|nr:ATP-binding protein [Caldilineaceae bacterium]
IYFAANLDTDAQLLSTFSQLIAATLHPEQEVAEGFRYQSWEAAFHILAAATSEQRLICVIDEYPYLAQAGTPRKRVATMLQNAWDQVLEDSQIFFVLCGSYLSVIEQHFLNRDAPLHGRRTGLMQLKPLSLGEFARFLPKYDAETLIESYAAVGGMPGHIRRFRDNRSLWANIRDEILTPVEHLYSEARFVLTDELREPRNYFAILRAIAAGAHRLNEIMAEGNIDERTSAQYYLETLLGLGIVDYRRPIGPEPPGRQWGRYHIVDPYFQFWFRWVFPLQSRLDLGDQERVIEQYIRPEWSRFVAGTWEQLCREFLVPAGLDGRLPFIPEEVGKWWSHAAEIDVVGVDRQNKRVLLGEARWQARPMGEKALNELMDKARPWLQKSRGWRVTYALFSRAGFSQDVIQIAADQPGEIYLFGPEDLASRPKAVARN